MKTKIHPTYYQDAEVICACGNIFTTGSTQKKIQVDICSACHPFYTGEMKFVDTQGRVEKFQQKMQARPTEKYLSKKQRQQAKRQAETEPTEPRTLREMIQDQKNKTKKD